jgi:hypothetical protein
LFIFCLRGVPGLQPGPRLLFTGNVQLAEFSLNAQI